MAEYRNFGELYSGNRENQSRSQISEHTMDTISKERYKEQEEKKKQKEHGKMTYTEIGMKDRLFCKKYDIANEQYKKDPQSYIYGYIIKGNDIIKNYLIGHKIIPTRFEIESNVEELLYNIGVNDALNGIIIYEDLPFEIKNNENYLQGYEQGLNKSNKKGR